MTATATAATAARATAKRIPVHRIDPDPAQPRKQFADAALDELAESMRRIGQVQPVTVRYRPAERRYTLIAGERRWRAARRAGIDMLDALVRHDVADADVLPLAVAENVGRVDMTPMEEAEAFSRLRAAGHTVDDVAGMCGKTAEYVGYRLDLLTLTDACVEAVERGHLPVGTAWYCSRLTPAGQQRFLRKWVRGEFPSARDAEAFAQACRVNEAAARDQADLFLVVEMTPQRREQIAATRRQVTSRVDRLAGAGRILADLAATDPAVLAQALAGADGGVGAYRMRVEQLRAAAGKALSTLRRAGAIAAAAAPDTDFDLAGSLLDPDAAVGGTAA